MIRIALSGDRGRMGKRLKNLIKKYQMMEVRAQANRNQYPKQWKAEDIDVVIDFSLPELFSKSLKWSLQNKKPFVSGTTGLSPYQKRNLKNAGKKIPIFYETNMSAGIFLLSKWVKDFFYEKSSIHIEDIHHKNKKDQPSGTALKLKENLPKVLQNKVKITSLRKGQTFGTHRIKFKSSREILTLEHKALNRDVFAQGALYAMFFILKKKKGIYGASELYSQKTLPKLY